MDRILVAASLAGHRRLRAIFRGVQADYATSYAGGVEALLHKEYPLILVDVLFAESRMLKFARFVKEQQPSAHVVCVNVTGYPLNDAARSEIEERLRRLGYKGLIDLKRVWGGHERRYAGADRRGRPRPRDRGDRRAAPALTL
jgi:hypothetical protein